MTLHPEAAAFHWTGDTDEQTCEIQGYFCHVEHLNRNCWHASVTRGRRGPYLFHADEHDVLPKTLAAAKWLCEAFVLADLWRKEHA